MPKLNVQQNNQNVIQAFKNALAIGRLKGIIASDGNHNFSTSGSNDNLLDNAYFVGGGSQLGDGVFPINQRGQTQYTAAGFVFDRWFKSGGVTVTLDAGGLTIANSNGWPDGINQRFPMHFFAQMNGEAITASVLYADGSVDSGTAIIDATQNYQWLKYPDAGEIGFQLKNFQDGAPYDYFDYISFGAGPNSTPKKIKKFKLEKGSISTLANDVRPDFGEELRKCQRHFLRIQPSASLVIGTGLMSSTTNARLFIPTPATMRTTPTIAVTNIGQMRACGAGTTVTPSAASVQGLSANGVCVNFTVATGIAANEVVAFTAPNTAYIDLSADL